MHPRCPSMNKAQVWIHIFQKHGWKLALLSLYMDKHLLRSWIGLSSHETLTTTYFKVAKRFLHYLKYMIDFGLFYLISQYCKPVGYSASDWLGDVDDQKSKTGFVFFMGDSAFTWVSKKQAIIMLSTCKTEYVAATLCVCHVVWFKNLLTELSLT